MRIPGIRKVPCGVKGLGLVAEVDIPAGTVVWIPCPACRRWTADELAALPPTEREQILELGYYLSDGAVLLPCGDFCSINHSCAANVLDSLRGFDLAVEDIRAGEELTYDYRVFRYEPEWQFPCACGADRCIGTVRSARSIPAELAASWEARLAPALARMGHVPQPLGDPFAGPLLPGPPAGSPPERPGRADP